MDSILDEFDYEGRRERNGDPKKIHGGLKSAGKRVGLNAVRDRAHGRPKWKYQLSWVKNGRGRKDGK